MSNLTLSQIRELLDATASGPIRVVVVGENGEERGCFGNPHFDLFQGADGEEKNVACVLADPAEAYLFANAHQIISALLERIHGGPQSFAEGSTVLYDGNIQVTDT